MPILRFNRRLLWTVLGCICWAYLVLGAALAQVGAERYPAAASAPGLRLRLPPGALLLPGRLIEVREDAGQLNITLAVREKQDGVARGRDGEPLSELPPGLHVDYLTEQQLAGSAVAGSPPHIATLSGQDRPLRLPGGKEVIVAQDFYLSLNRHGVALIPHHGEGLRILDGPLRRRGWSEQRDGRGGGERERQRNWLRDLFQEKREPRERGGAGRGSDRRDRPAPEGEAYPPPKDGHMPPPDGDHHPPHEDGRPPGSGRNPPPKP